MQNIPALIHAFTSAVKAKDFSSPELEEYYTLFRLAHVQSHDSDREIDIIYSTMGLSSLLQPATVQHPTQNDGPHHTTRTSCRSLVLTRRLLSCMEEASKSDHARRTHEFWENASRFTCTGSVQEGHIRRPAKALRTRSLGTFKPRPDRPLGHGRVHNYSYNHSNNNRRHRLTSFPKTNTPCPGMQHDSGRRTKNNPRRPAPLLHSRNAQLQHATKSLSSTKSK